MMPNERDPHDPREKPPSRIPFSRPPAEPKSWWGSTSGQLALVAILVGAIVIFMGLIGVIGPLSQR
jgi:hypothetical protein